MTAIYTPNIIGNDNTMINPLRMKNSARAAGPIINFEYKSIKKRINNFF